MSHNDCQAFLCVVVYLYVTASALQQQVRVEEEEECEKMQEGEDKKRYYTRFKRGGGAGREDTE